jgi:hypothetical protein
MQPARHQLGEQQRPAPARQRVRIHVLDAIVIGAQAPEQVSELRGVAARRAVSPWRLSDDGPSASRTVSPWAVIRNPQISRHRSPLFRS